MYYNEEHKKRVEERGDGYIYIGSYHRNEETIDGKNKNKNKIKRGNVYIRVKCPYCEKEYDVQLSGFIGKYKVKCTNCCNEYENSFAYYIQVELGESLNKYWNWGENNVNPYLINKKSNIKIKIYCQEKEYHNNDGGYEITPYRFYKGSRCGYCYNSKVHPKDSFAQWGIDTFGEDFLEKYWSGKNKINPWEIKPQSAKKIWLLCQEKDYHNDYGGYKITADAFYYGNKCSYCGKHKTHPKDSFGQWLIDEYGDNAIERYWSPKNKSNPFEISPKSKVEIWLLCQEKDYHNDFGGYKTTPDSFSRHRRCPYCVSKKVHPKDSFGQWLIDEFGNDAIDKYWSFKNKLNPFEISKLTPTKKIWILCQDKDYHNDYGGYETTPNLFYHNHRCPYCRSLKIHYRDSFGALYPEKAKYWNYEKNKKSPYEVAQHSHTKYKFICENCGDEFEKDLHSLNASNVGVLCERCNGSELEKKTKDILVKYNISYKTQIKYRELLGLGNGNLSYDFYLPDYNLLIECQGEQHERFIRGFHETEESFEKQLEHDRRKREYAKKNNIDLLEIWYYDMDSIEEILIEKLYIENN